MKPKVNVKGHKEKRKHAEDALFYRGDYFCSFDHHVIPALKKALQTEIMITLQSVYDTCKRQEITKEEIAMQTKLLLAFPEKYKRIFFHYLAETLNFSISEDSLKLVEKAFKEDLAAVCKPSDIAKAIELMFENDRLKNAFRPFSK